MKRERKLDPFYIRETPCPKCGGFEFFTCRKWVCRECNRVRGLAAYRAKKGLPPLEIKKSTSHLFNEMLRKKF